MSENPFLGYAQKLVANGLRVFPVAPGQKYPARFRRDEKPQWKPMLDWNQVYSNRPPSEDELCLWGHEYPETTGIGLLLGEASGVIGLDFDINIDGMHQVIEDFIEESNVKKTGEKGYTSFYRYNGEDSRSWKLKDENGHVKTVIELLAGGKQTVLPPSRHPEGMFYTWESDDFTLANIQRDQLPTLPAGFEARMDELFGRTSKRYVPSEASVQADYEFGPTSLDKARLALSYIDADSSYQEWVEIGMGLKDYFGDAGLDLWDEWSRGGSKYKAHECVRKWRSFKGHGSSIASVFYHAQQAGFINVPEIQTVAPMIKPGGNLTRSPVITQVAEITPEQIIATQPISLPTTENKAIITAKFAEYEPGTKKYLFNEAPGTVGRIARWMTSTAIYPDPVLNIACAISFMGVLMSHKAQTETGLRSNMYTMGIAPSGTGKDHARKCCRVLLEASGQDHLLSGQPASSSGLFSAVFKNNGRTLILMDEFGRVLAGMTGRNASSHQQGIPTLMMELFSSSNGKFLGTEYGNRDGKSDRTDIQQPCLSVYATTTPEPLYETLTSGQAVDGFLSRWLLFESTQFLVEGKKAVSMAEVPASILNDLLKWKDADTNCAPKGNLEAHEVIKPRIVKYSEEASRASQAFQLDMRAMAKRHLDQGTGLHAVFTRTAEHAAKLALIGHSDDVITEDVYDWACQLAFDRSLFLAGAVRDNVSDSAHEAYLKRMMRHIAKGNGDWISKRDLVRKTQDIKKRDREEILMTLIESGMIEHGMIEAGGQRPMSVYRSVSSGLL